MLRSWQCAVTLCLFISVRVTSNPTQKYPLSLMKLQNNILLKSDASLLLHVDLDYWMSNGGNTTLQEVFPLFAAHRGEVNGVKAVLEMKEWWSDRSIQHNQHVNTLLKIFEIYSHRVKMNNLQSWEVSIWTLETLRSQRRDKEGGPACASMQTVCGAPKVTFLRWNCSTDMLLGKKLTTFEQKLYVYNTEQQTGVTAHWRTSEKEILFTSGWKTLKVKT